MCIHSMFLCTHMLLVQVSDLVSDPVSDLVSDLVSDPVSDLVSDLASAIALLKGPEVPPHHHSDMPHNQG